MAEPGRFESALLIPVPSAAAVVDALRLRLDPSAGRGVPAHVTILYPFVPPEALDAAVAAELESLFGDVPAFSFELRTVKWFGTTVVWLAPEPDTPFRELTRRVTARWRDVPPYGGAVSDPVPHLTIGDGATSSELKEAARQVSESLPIAALAREVWLMTGTSSPNTWTLDAAFPLGGAQS
jgi:2'-5' RNA ligase